MLSCNSKAVLAMGVALVMLFATWTETTKLNESTLFERTVIIIGR